MSRRALERYEKRASALLEAGPPSTRGETDEWLIRPFLCALGWELPTDVDDSAVTIDGGRVEYLLTAGEEPTPALYVAIEPATESLDPEREDRIAGLMGRTGVDRALYTTGQRLRLLAGPTGADRRTLEMGTLSTAADDLAHYSRDRLDSRLSGSDAELVGRRLAARRDSLAESLATELAAVGGEASYSRFHEEGSVFVEELVQLLLEGSDRDDTELGAESYSKRSTDQPTETDSKRTMQPTEEQSSSDPPSVEAVAPTDDPDGEYVVRFFSERGSVGAIGHSTSAGALAEAAEYLFDRGFSGVRLPWGPEEGQTVLNDEPRTADGTPMGAYQQLSNGRYVHTAGTVADRADRIEALAARAGFRAMLTGDWGSERE